MSADDRLTTEEVRNDYQWGVNACSCCATRDEADVQAFDRWLARVRAEAAADALDHAAKVYGPAQLTGFFAGNTAYTVAWLRERAARIRAGDAS